MPVLPSEEETSANITEEVAQNPSSNTESTASDHPIHQQAGGSEGYDGSKARAQDFNATPGPVIPLTKEDLPPAASKDELKARAAELNKDD
ncbi:MAG: hypothetical protein M1826_003396 [Phylliscum demangeonii]|nr:MAG: hypothetical protein M1826_003396 [Phylliscum demangeonii]